MAYPLSVTVSVPQLPRLVQQEKTLHSSASAVPESRFAATFRQSSALDTVAACGFLHAGDRRPLPCEKTQCGESTAAWQRPGGTPPGRPNLRLPETAA